ncbi:MAG: MBL fold metallo-hydrolase [Micromonosporaceae bacterium]
MTSRSGRAAGAWREIADRVYVLRHPVLDVNATVVVGEDAAMVVDTLSTPSQAGELADAVRRVTSVPWLVANTHHHFDHAYGNQRFAEQPGCQIWGHEEAARRLREVTPRRLGELYDKWAGSEPALAGLLDVTVVPPNRTLRDGVTLDLGGREVALHHFGHGHTDGDIVVHVPDGGVLIAGDLVEEGAPPGFEDSYPLQWPHTVAELLHLPTEVVVPGHGALVDHDFVTEQHDQLTQLAWLIREGHADGAPAERVAAKAPFGTDVALTAVKRGYAELSGGI